MAILRACAICATPSRGPYCTEHQPRAWEGSQHRQRMGLSGGAWDRIRRQILDRDQSTCYLCDRPGATEVDHLVELAAGGTNDPSNLASAHPDCHRRKHRDPEWAEERIQRVLAVLRTPPGAGNPRSRPEARTGAVAGLAGAGGSDS